MSRSPGARVDDLGSAGRQQVVPGSRRDLGGERNLRLIFLARGVSFNNVTSVRVESQVLACCFSYQILSVSRADARNSAAQWLAVESISA